MSGSPPTGPGGAKAGKRGPVYALREAILRRWPLAPIHEARSVLAGRRVLVIGNGNCLREQAPSIAVGPDDVVLRFNRAPSLEHLPGRTDVLATSLAVSWARLNEIAPAHVFWLNPRRRRMRLRWLAARRFRLLANDPSHNDDLRRRLGVDRPSSGATAIDLLITQLGVRPELYGFDGFASGSIGRKRPATDTPHDFAREAEWLAELARDGRIVWHKP